MLFQNFEKIFYTVIVNLSVAIHSYLSECLQSTVYPCHLTLLQELHLDLQVKPNFAVLKRIICFPCTLTTTTTTIFIYPINPINHSWTISEEKQKKVFYSVLFFLTVSHQFTLCLFLFWENIEFKCIFWRTEIFFYSHLFVAISFRDWYWMSSSKKVFFKVLKRRFST